MYLLMKNQLASKSELDEHFTLDEALKLYAFLQMEVDLQSPPDNGPIERR